LGYTFNTSSGKTTALNRLVVFLYKIALKSNIIVFFQNPDDLSLFRENSIIGNKTDGIVLNGSGVDINHFKMETVPQEISFLLIARLIKEKGVLEYIEAARVIKAMHPEIRFRLVGWIENGPNAFKKADIDAWAAEGTIDYLGKLGDVRESIAKSAVYVLPSYREGTPRTVLEAMAMGRPIITTDAPGCRETVCHGFNGFLVPIQDITALVEAMKVFIRTPDQIEVMGKRSRMMVVEKYDVNKINQKMTGNLSVACIDKNIGL
jgi:glycosyltransferase involved in cell wall biosynthesis